MIADEPAPDAIAWNGLNLAPTVAELEAEAHAAAEADPIAAMQWRNATEEERARALRDAATTRANAAVQEAEATRPLTPTEAAQAYEISKAEADRLGYPTVAEYLDAVDPIRPAGEPPPESEAEYLAWLASNGVTGEEAEAFRKVLIGTPFPEPEDRGTATLSALGDVETIGDLVKPGRIATVAAEEGSGKSFLALEMAVRVAAAGGSFAGTWPVLRTGPVLYLSEMHSDDDYGREATVLDSLGLERPALAGRYYRLPLMTAAGGRPALTVPEWRVWVTGWLRDHAALLLIVDTATGATQVDPWGRDIQAVYSGLRVMLAEYPDLAIVLLIHLKKPQGRGERRISDVLGEWGRWCDVVILMENDGNGLTRARLTVRKRVRRERRIVVTKAGGLLIDPQDLDEAKGTKVPLDDVLAAIVAAPGITYAELGAAVGVSKDTATRYVEMLGDQVDAVRGTGKSGPGARMRLYSIAASPHVAAQAQYGDPAAIPEAIEGPPSGESPHRRIASIDAATRAATPASPPVRDGDGLNLSVDWPMP